MSRISRCFTALTNSNKKALIPFITGGDPDLKTTSDLILSLAESGADLIEIGIPFSDPLADGPVIQRSFQRALLNKTSLNDIIKMVKGIRDKIDIPVILMSSYNPILKMGEELFVKKCLSSGIDGLIIPDLPPEESDSLLALIDSSPIDVILLVAPTTTEKRLQLICKQAKGFIYYISLTGITGTNIDVSKDIRENVNKIKAFTHLPVAVGFGISNTKQASLTSSLSNGIIIGSAIVKIMEENTADKSKLIIKVSDFTRKIKAVL